MNTFRQIIFLFSALVLPFASFGQVNVLTTTLQSSIELLWEAHTYTPPLYRGKALYVTGGEVSIIALPPPSFGSPSSLTYTWKKDGVVDGAQSGVGKRTFTFSGTQFGESPLIVVEVSNQNQKGFGALRLTQTEPLVRFYENKPLEGITFERALPRTLLTTEQSVDLEAYPYFFSADSRSATDVVYSWTANGKTLGDASGPSFSVITEELGTIALQLSVYNAKRVLQRGAEGIRISFE